MSMDKSLYDSIKDIHRKIQADILGGSPIEKCFQMGYLIDKLDLHCYVEIGVYRGMSLFTVSEAIKRNGGKTYGIDPYRSINLKENELSKELKEVVDHAANTMDFNELYSSVLEKKIELGLDETVTLLRKTSEDALEYFLNHDLKIDILHIDGNHDRKFVQFDADHYIPLVSEGGIIVIDDIDWSGIRPVYEALKQEFIMLFENENYGILLKQKETESNSDQITDFENKLCAYYENVRETELNPIPTVIVGMMTYNLENYIERALQSVFNQKGSFRIIIAIFDDCSTDGSIAKISEVSAKYKNVFPPYIEIQIYPNDQRNGLVKNYQRMLKKVCEINCDFFAMLDGDDYWTDADRLQKHINYLNSNPDCAFSFNSIIVYNESENKYETLSIQQDIIEAKYDIFDLLKTYYLGNGSCSCIRRSALNNISDEFFQDIFTGDWFLHVLFSRYGDIGYIKEPLSVYRRHPKGNWSAHSQTENNKILFDSINKFNKITNYRYYPYLSDYQMQLYNHHYKEPFEELDLLIIDDVFPHPSNGYRYQEYTSYLEHFYKMRILCTGVWTHLLGSLTNEECLIQYKRTHPDLADKLIGWHGYAFNGNIHCKLAYICFLGNAFPCIEMLESNNIPFILELYPGGSFALHDETSDAMLHRVISSKCFRKVIVTQKVTYNYLIENDFCSKEYILDIFGVVTPIDILRKNYGRKLHYGFEKQTIDVCFVAMKYTEFGIDKGYDIFINVAKEMCKKYDNIYFHVAGGFDESIIDVSDIQNRINFYGVQKQDWFDEFYKDKDIILSPNVQGYIKKGSFDGFPTGCCTDAGLRETAIFCTDELGLNDSHFTDGEEIVLIEHDATDIITKIEYYINHPEKLKSIAVNGQKKIKENYGYEKQIRPRIDLLENLLAQPFISKDEDNERIKVACEPSRYTRLYIDIGNGMSEEETLIQPIQNEETLRVYFDLKKYKGKTIHTIRWDPIEREYVEVSEIAAFCTDNNGEKLTAEYSWTNGYQIGDRYLFLTKDPVLVYPVGKELDNFQISCRLRIVEADEIINTRLQQIDCNLQAMVAEKQIKSGHRMEMYLQRGLSKLFHKLK